MLKKLLIVESPAKAKTIEKYLGNGFVVLASYGHVMDLIPKSGSIDLDNDFAPKYEIIKKNVSHINAIAKEIKLCDALYLATDPDREGEAIAWHVLEIMRKKKLIGKKQVHRVVFHEITKTAVQKAISEPKSISMDLVDAQKTRRILDYLVGFNISPLLWKKIYYGLSAGRVQSPALCMIVERENEIRNFVSQEYWTLFSNLVHHNSKFSAKLITYDGKKLDQFDIKNEQEAANIKINLERISEGYLIVEKLEKKQKRRHPSPPFTTSTLQQFAINKLGFTANRTMRIAQQLYEGINIGNETIGLITYMRTDSVVLSNECISEVRSLIISKFGKENLPEKPCFYRNKVKNAQEAHEAIRPTSCMRLPGELEKFLTKEQYKLYDLIWKRTVACQMVDAVINTTSVYFRCGQEQHKNLHIFKAVGSVVDRPGFMSVYIGSSNTSDEVDCDSDSSKKKSDENDDSKLLPSLDVGDIVKLLSIDMLQHFTEPPPRYNEASLVKTLEEHGIGRPSTYASIIDTLKGRGYVILENKKFKPTDVAFVVSKFLKSYFTEYVDYDFTAKLEDHLDGIARGEEKFLPILKSFWFPLKSLIDQTELNVQRKDVVQTILDEKCPDCGCSLVMRLSRNGCFIGCDGYPNCRYIRKIEEEKSGKSEEESGCCIVDGNDVEATEKLSTNQSLRSKKNTAVPKSNENDNVGICPLCNSPLKKRRSKYGEFIGCSGYPNCKYKETKRKKEQLPNT